jgi:phenylpropionate dioxygenase-like ring-hydroxylating dioxygenase large terminal subunit
MTMLIMMGTGWSYGLNGNLAKAPKYEAIPDFDKKRNGLFPIHIHVDKRGFIWVNLDAGERPSVPWSTEFLGADEQERLDDFKMNEYSFDHAWTMNGEFNWKTLLDNYNEVYKTPCLTS